MDAAEAGEGTDYDKSFIEEPAILDKYKAAAEVCDSKFHFTIYYRQSSNLDLHNQRQQSLTFLI